MSKHWQVDELRSILPGTTIVRVECGTIDEPNDAISIIVRDPLDGAEYSLTVSQDDEGNGPGTLFIDTV